MPKRHPGRPPKSEWPSCRIEGCGRTTKNGSKGFCQTHYMQTRRGNRDVETGAQTSDFARVRRYLPGTHCLVPQCDGEVVGRHLCNKHYIAWKSGKELGVSVPSYNSEAVKRSVPKPHPVRKEEWVGREGYVLVKAPAWHPHARQDGSILKHRLVMEEKVGRYLEEWEIVHHKDGNRSNNDEANLELLDGRSQRAGPGHHPGHEFDVLAAVQVLLQQQDLLPELRSALIQYRERRLPKASA